MPPNAAEASHALVLLNARSGPGRDAAAAEEVRRRFADAGLAVQVLLLQGGEGVAAAIASARAAGVRLVVAGGGDGTQSAVAAHLAGTELVQGVLPLGTLNHFARDLGIPLALEDAIGVIATGRVRRVDVGEVNGQVFVNNSSIGLYPEIVRDRELQQLHLGKGKWRALASAILRRTRKPHGLAVRIAGEGDDQLHRTPFVFVGNNRYVMEGLRIGARERMDVGELAVYTVRGRGRRAFLLLALRALTGRLEQDRDFEMRTGAEFVIRTRDARVRVATDGEVAMMDTPLRYAVRRQALQVLVPADAGPPTGP